MDAAVPTIGKTSATGRIALLWVLTLLSTSTIAAALGAEVWNRNWLLFVYLLGMTSVNMSLPYLAITTVFVLTKRKLQPRAFLSILAAAFSAVLAVGTTIFLLDLAVFQKVSGAKSLFDRDYR